ncbi:MAG: peptide chain release factor N(5)-glutamine methyltransferase [Desulfocapsaceae bacterium]|jgi:release factor glutamine methyltransferase|nr:peptide chain release factor N(5)-glutamine methyltransferase [Desulfocapsaceae bacterium]
MADAESSVGFLLQQAISELQLAGIEEARTDATQLLCSCLCVSRTTLYLSAAALVPEDRRHRFAELLLRRKQREPLAYILGEREFWSLNFVVTPDVLIPRPETEFLLESVFAKRNRSILNPRVLDMCCGSGVIAVVLARQLNQQVTAVDCSRAALAVARENCLRHAVDSRVSLLHADLFSAFQKSKSFSLIVSNPPYIRYADIVSVLEPEVSRHEPLIALDGGASGLEVIEKIINALGEMLACGGDFFMEIGADQREPVASLFNDHGGDDIYEFVTCYADYSGRDRIIHARRRKH